MNKLFIINILCWSSVVIAQTNSKKIFLEKTANSTWYNIEYLEALKSEKSVVKAQDKIHIHPIKFTPFEYSQDNIVEAWVNCKGGIRTVLCHNINQISENIFETNGYMGTYSITKIGFLNEDTLKISFSNCYKKELNREVIYTRTYGYFAENTLLFKGKWQLSDENIINFDYNEKVNGFFKFEKYALNLAKDWDYIDFVKEEVTNKKLNEISSNTDFIIFSNDQEKRVFIYKHFGNKIEFYELENTEIPKYSLLRIRK